MKHYKFVLLCIAIVTIALFTACSNKQDNEQKVYFYNSKATQDSLINNGFLENAGLLFGEGTDDLHLIPYRSGVASVKEGQEIILAINGEEKSLVLDYCNSKINGVLYDELFVKSLNSNGINYEIYISKSGDFLGITSDVRYDPTKPIFEESVLKSKAIELINEYNINVITQKPVLKIEDYSITEEGFISDEDSAYYLLSLKANKKKGWMLYSNISVMLNRNGELYLISYKNPGWLDEMDLPEYIGDELLSEKVHIILLEYSHEEDFDDIAIVFSDNYNAISGVNFSIIDSPSVMRADNGKMGIYMRVYFKKGGNNIGETRVFVPFDSLID